MKKFLIIMLSVLLLLSFTSCEKDKSGDVIAAFEKFAAEKKVADAVYSIAQNTSDETISKDSIDSSALKGLLVAYLENGGKIEKAEVTSASGTITREGNTRTLNVTIGYKGYAVVNETSGYSATLLDVKIAEGTLTITGSWESKLENAESAALRGEGYSITTRSYNIKVNDDSYDLSYTYNGLTKKFTAASVGGTGVELRLLNAGK